MTLRFCGIGAMRCATTWTFACLKRDPDIEFPGGKQIHFWDKNRDNGLDWYRNIFDGDLAGHRDVAEGEITPAYAILDQETVAEFKALAPDLRVWFVMRHPIDRAWSSVRLHLRRNEIDPATLDDEWFRHRLTRRSIMKRNSYAQTLATWRSQFGDEAVLALPYSMVAAEPTEFLARIAEHIGVDTGPFVHPDDAMHNEMAKVRNVGYELEMSAELRELAAETYADEIAWFESKVDAP